MIKQLVAATALTLFAMPAMATTTVFSNTTPIVVVDGGETTSNIVVSGLTSPVTALTLTLTGLSHTYPDDLVFGLLNDTLGRGIVFFSGAGGSTDISNVNLTFDDTASSLLPESFVDGAITSGTYLPSNYGGYEFTFFDTFDSFTEAFAGFSGNGSWTLYVDDVFPADGGSVAGGFSLAITTADATAVPEPASWAMMIGGFGLVGSAMRRRATTTKVAFA